VLVDVQAATRQMTPPAQKAFAKTVTQALNGALFAVIVIEVLRTTRRPVRGPGSPPAAVPADRDHRPAHPHGRGPAVAARCEHGTVLILELIANAGVVLVAASVMFRRWARPAKP
jgi:hypothetical protein